MKNKDTQLLVEAYEQKVINKHFKALRIINGEKILKLSDVFELSAPSLTSAIRMLERNVIEEVEENLSDDPSLTDDDINENAYEMVHTRHDPITDTGYIYSDDGIRILVIPSTHPLFDIFPVSSNEVELQYVNSNLPSLLAPLTK